MALSFMAALAVGTVAFSLYGLGMLTFLGIILPYAAILVFLAGCVRRVLRWSSIPVPFAIPTTAGQQKSLSWIRPSPLEAPTTTAGVIGRMALEILCFRSLFRNTSAELRLETPTGARLIYWSSKWLWGFALLFHYSILVIVIRHFRFFLEPTPLCLKAVEFLDGIMQIGVPRFFMSDATLVAALLFLLLRRLYDPKIRYISNMGDYFPLFLLLGIALSGIALRYGAKADIASVKEFTLGLVTFSPAVSPAISPIFYVHLAFVSTLLIVFPFSKLTHMAGIFFSPTRNLPCDTRAKRHINPWNPPKKYHTYAEYEDDFREVMAEAGLPLEKQPEQATE